jgi:hypothetical protein
MGKRRKGGRGTNVRVVAKLSPNTLIVFTTVVIFLKRKFIPSFKLRQREVVFGELAASVGGLTGRWFPSSALPVRKHL